MKEWEIWTEGCCDNEVQARAVILGFQCAETFDEACIILLGYQLDREKDGSYRRGTLRNIMEPGIDRYAAVQKGGNFSINWCQLFPTEEEARKSFG